MYAGGATPPAGGGGAAYAGAAGGTASAGIGGGGAPSAGGGGSASAGGSPRGGAGGRPSFVALAISTKRHLAYLAFSLMSAGSSSNCLHTSKMCEAARNAFPVRRSERPARSASSARWKRSWAKFSTVIAGSSISPSAPFSFSHWSMRERTNPMSAFGTLARSFIASWSAKRRQWYATIGSFAWTSEARSRYGLTDLRETGQSIAR